MSHSSTPTLAVANTGPGGELTESKLFAQFLESSFVEYDRFGRHLYRHDVAGLLEGYNDYIDVDLQLCHAGDDPSYHLEMVESELAVMLANVRLAGKVWEKLKAKRLVSSEEPDEADTDAYAAWEREEDTTRYHPAIVVSEALEAA